MDIWPAVEQFVMHARTAGVVGVLLSLRFTPTGSPGEVASSIGLGIGAVLYLSPWVMETMELFAIPAQVAFCFVFGLGAAPLLVKGLEWFRATPFWSAVWTVIDALRGVRDSGTKQ